LVSRRRRQAASQKERLSPPGDDAPRRLRPGDLAALNGSFCAQATLGGTTDLGELSRAAASAAVQPDCCFGLLFNWKLEIRTWVAPVGCPPISARRGRKVIPMYIGMMLWSGILAHRQARVCSEATGRGNPQSATRAAQRSAASQSSIQNLQSAAGFCPRCVSAGQGSTPAAARRCELGHRGVPRRRSSWPLLNWKSGIGNWESGAAAAGRGRGGSPWRGRC